jgi:hypothetical protein
MTPRLITPGSAIVPRQIARSAYRRRGPSAPMCELPGQLPHHPLASPRLVGSLAAQVPAAWVGASDLTTLALPQIDRRGLQPLRFGCSALCAPLICRHKYPLILGGMERFPSSRSCFAFGLVVTLCDRSARRHLHRRRCPVNPQTPGNTPARRPQPPGGQALGHPGEDGPKTVTYRDLNANANRRYG